MFVARLSSRAPCGHETTIMRVLRRRRVGHNGRVAHGGGHFRDGMDDRLTALPGWVVKDGILLGGLTHPMRMQVLALAWAGLPAAGPHSERQINQLLKTQIATTLCFVDVDHVELRRWLVDTQWLWRDGFGRDYRRVAIADMASEQAALADTVLRTVGGQGAAAWVQAERSARQVQREARRRDWQAREAGAVNKGAS